MENITFSFNTVIGLIGGIVGLCVVVFNRAISDLKDLKEWQIAQDNRLKEIERTGSVKLREFEMCIDYIKKEMEKIKKRKNAKS